MLGSSLNTTAIFSPGVYCGYTFTETTLVENVRVHIWVEYIDGVNGILGLAGPCAVDANNFPRFGVIVLDSADAEDMNNDGTLNEVMRHEFGHVLGLGTLWEAGTTYSETGIGFGHPYLLPFANQAHSSLGGSGSAKVEDDGGSGTFGAHWKESVYDHELMTGYVEASGAMPLSNLTVSALKDLGYDVVLSNAESYVLPGRRRRLRGGRRHYYNCTEKTKTFVTIPTV